MPYGMARRCYQNLISAWKSCTEGESLGDGSESMWEVKVRLGELCTRQSLDVLKGGTAVICVREQKTEKPVTGKCLWFVEACWAGMANSTERATVRSESLKKEYFRRLCLSCLFCFWSSCCWHRWSRCSQWQGYVWLSWLDIAKCICSGWAGSCVFWTSWLC